MNKSNNHKILILGCEGLIGNQICEKFIKLKNYNVSGTITGINPKLKKYNNTKKLKIINNFKISIKNIDKKIQIIQNLNPKYVINCIGITKKLAHLNKLNTLLVNSLFPYLLRKKLKKETKIIHISSDCVFDGVHGNYSEVSKDYTNDFYGLSKKFGEYKKFKNLINIRTSVIGNEVSSKNGLLNWFLNQKSEITGFKNVFFSGLTTNEFAKIVADIFNQNKLYNKRLIHIGGTKISKYQLLKILNSIYKKKIKIKISKKERLDRSLNSMYFYKKFNYKPKTWNALIKQMKIENEKIQK